MVSKGLNLSLLKEQQNFFAIHAKISLTMDTVPKSSATPWTLMNIVPSVPPVLEAAGTLVAAAPGPGSILHHPGGAGWSWGRCGCEKGPLSD